MANRTISLPDDVVPIIETLDLPFSRWVAEQLRRHAAETSVSFAEQLERDSVLAAERPPSAKDAGSIGRRMNRTAPW